VIATEAQPLREICQFLVCGSRKRPREICQLLVCGSRKRPRYHDGVRVAVVGGGINGAGIAWELARRDYQVTLFEKGRCGAQTSSATTKLIHGGLRYLEGLHLRLVREALHDRAWLLEHAKHLVHPLEIFLPVYDDSPRSRFAIRAGLVVYDALAGRDNIRRHRVVGRDELASRVPLRTEGLRGGFSLVDGQTDDAALVQAVVEAARREGAAIREQTAVTALRRAGNAWILATRWSGGLQPAEDEPAGDKTAAFDETHFDVVVNAAGPWMNELLAANRIRSRYRLTLVRGSHLVLSRPLADAGLLLQSVSDRRIFFVLPWKGMTLVGTTEVVQQGVLDGVVASEEEIEYLIARYNRYLRDPIGRQDVVSTFAGVRPLVGRSVNPSAIGREYRLERRGSLINVFGGKMTTFLSLARKVAMRVDNAAGRGTSAREPRL
jgi:glycerol-3-phosphate dehydrogenase